MKPYVHIDIRESFEKREDAEKFMRCISRMRREMEAEYGELFYSRSEVAVESGRDFETGKEEHHVTARFGAKIRG